MCGCDEAGVDDSGARLRRQVRYQVDLCEAMRGRSRKKGVSGVN